MAHTDARSQWLDQGATVWSPVLLVCLLLLPFTYSMFVTLISFFGLGVWQTFFYPNKIFSLLYKNGFIPLGVLLFISACFANFPGEAYLQLTHFLPFFWFWAMLALYLTQTLNPWQQLYHWAIALVITVFPLNLVGIAEYVLKQIYPPDQLVTFPLIDWLYIGDLDVPRAYSLFDYPNTLASYLIMVLGLNIGLVLLRPQTSQLGQLPLWARLGLSLNILLTLICLFCSGSRNGSLVAAALIIVGFFGSRTGRWMRSLGLVGLALLVTMILRFGMAGRTLSWSWFTDDPRVQVWALALDMIRDRPILGQGLGNYKLLYNGEVPGYDYIAHAHNFWLMLASEAGLPATLLFTLVVGIIWYRAVKALLAIQSLHNHYSLLMGYHLCFLGIVLFSIFDITLSEARVNFLAWLSLSVIYAGTKLSQRLATKAMD